MSELKKLTFAELPTLDGGRMALAFDQALERVIADCDDRPGDGKPRKITLEFIVKPTLDSQGLCESVKAAWHIKDTVPSRKSRVYDFGMRRGMLIYQADSLDNHRQNTLGLSGDNDDVS